MGEKETTSAADSLAAKQAPEKKDKAEAVQDDSPNVEQRAKHDTVKNSIGNIR